jgi:hypothetical protein
MSSIFEENREMRRELWRRHGFIGGTLRSLAMGFTHALASLWFGPVRAGLLLAEASLLNGCAHCGHHHVLRFELAHFRRTGKLFPLDENAFVALGYVTDEALRATLGRAFDEAGLAKERALFERLHALKLGREKPRGLADRLLVNAIRLMDTVNQGCITAHRPLELAVRGPRGLKAAYAAARLADTNRA